MGQWVILVASLVAAAAAGSPAVLASAPLVVYVFDLTPTLTADPADAYELVHTVAALQASTATKVQLATFNPCHERGRA